MNTKTKEITLIGLMAAVTCIAGPLSLALPFSPVPISLTNLAIYFSVYILGMRRGTISYLVYLLLGLVGLPVFSAFTSGPAKLFGPTGGYLTGFIFMALISGYCIDRWNGQIKMSMVGMVAGTAVTYAFGTVWLAYQANMSLGEALAVGVYPFIAGDLAKMALTLLVAPQVRMRLRKAALN
ncbi:MAG: biotin transporter BioY [Lachnospiraceae bacterium]|jgi:biotin transport system substrate-specific component|nr:biotin transporter BioY [Lachnospiraceae bacterium]MDE6920015.1 biotin transporter BioY [Lachnospiraceae bacterium]MDE6942295.1 biotin transporter BioY [Lachnospiraceae bacterium]MDE6989630.1 biotin transporter BioY [Lachnospiraceae bacterium]MDE7001128.1 biotin transporter BioY [Lachnospiraceae bacterium]